MKKILYLLLILLYSSPFAAGEIYVDYEPDSLKNKAIPQIETIQNEIKSSETKTQTEKIPALPSHLKNDVNLSGTTQKIAKRTGHEIKKNTKFEVKLSQNISDKIKINTKVKFTSTSKQAAGSVILPAGTIFTGHIVQAHKPQMTSNGGLIKIVIDEIIYQNISNEMNAKILTLNGKNIGFNAIKGQRKYIKNTKNNMKWGIKTCKKCYKTTSSFSKKGGWYWAATPIPAILGTAAITANAVYAPLAAIFQKGGSVSLKSGSVFTIKLNQDMQIYVIDNL